MLIADIMIASVVTARPNDTVRRALGILEDLDIRHLPVIDDEGRVVGVVSDRDLREYWRSLDEPAAGAVDPLETPLAEVMSADVVTVDSQEEVSAAIDAMIEYRIGAVPVLDRSTGELVGIISYVDLLRLARDLLNEG
ncbi:MAG: CBS domain-containing protein [Nannocystaceae bacterium]